MSDFRLALRLLLKSPSFTVVALTTLALGLAANAAIFSIVNALLIRPLPYSEPERLVMLWQDLRARGGPEDEWLAQEHYFAWRDRSRLLESSAAFRTAYSALTEGGDPEQVRGWLVSHEMFRVLGIRPALGRDFTSADDDPGAPPTAILTHGLWTRRFGADRSIIGRVISLDREPHVVLGVLPASFQPVFGEADIFRPLRLNSASTSRGNIVLRMIAKLRPGVELTQARAEMATIGSALAVERPERAKGSTIRVTRLHDEVVGGVRTPLIALLGSVLLVLLIACANIANLQLARASVRRREIAVRTALGAGRARIVRQLLTESLVLGVVGSSAGLLLSSWALDALLTFAPRDTARLAEVKIDGVVLAFGVGLALATSIVFGLLPAFQGSGGDVASAIKEGGRGTGAQHAGVAARSAFVVVELALALVLLVGAGLLMRSLANIHGVEPGFAPGHLLTGILRLPPAAYEKPPQIMAFYRTLVQTLEAVPGIQRVALVNVLPFSGEDTDTGFAIEGRPKPIEPGDRPSAWYRVVTPSYLRTMGMRLEAGRFIEATDRENTGGAVVVNRTLANMYWRGENPIGARITAGTRMYTVVGIVGDVRHRDLRENPRGEMFLSYQQVGDRRMTLVLKTAADPAGVLPAVRERIASLDTSLPLASVRTVESLIADSLALPRMIAVLMATFAAASVVLAAIGIYGLMAYAVALRTQEFGIRMALGATSAHVLRLVLGQSARLALAGVVAGAAGAFAAGRFIQAMLFGVTTSDMPTFAATAAFLAATAMLASYLPARRAIRVDPIRSLRGE
jgi:putative ABC transport system permease protein